MNQELNVFIRESLAKGLSKEKIKEVLQRANWQPDEIEQAMAHFADVDFPLPVPKRKPYLSAREAFLYLLVFLTLYISAFNFGSLIFSFINRAFPDIISGYNYPGPIGNTDISFALASLIIGFPVYLLLSSYLSRRVKKDPEIRTSKVRKWLTYLTLFLTAGVIIGDFIALLNQLFGGELSTRFFLKFLTVLVIAVVIFLYYLSDLKKEEKEA